jgi:mono/diheme cytochrome c family protein
VISPAGKFSIFRRTVILLAAGLAVICAWEGIGRAEDVSGEPKAKVPIAVPSSNPFSGDPDAILEGNKLYFKWCAACHGENADGVSRFGAYAGNLTRFWRGYAEFIAIATRGRTDKMMPPWGGILDGIQLSKIGAYLETRAVQGANWK